MTVFFINPPGELTGTATPVEFTLDRAAINISIEWEPLDGPATDWDTVFGDTQPDFTGGRFAYRYADSTNVGSIWSIKPPNGGAWPGRFRIMVDEAPAGGGGDMPPGLVAKWTVTSGSSPEITPSPVIDTASGLAINATYPALLNGLKAPADSSQDYGIDVANLGTVSTYFNPGQSVASGMAPFTTASSTPEELKPGQKGYLIFSLTGGANWRWVPDAIAAPQPAFRTNTCITFISTTDAGTEGYQYPSPDIFDCTNYALEVWGSNYGLKGLPIPTGEPWNSGITVPTLATNVGGETLRVMHNADAGAVDAGYANIWNPTLADFDLAPGDSMVLIYNHQQGYDIGLLNAFDPDVERWWAFPLKAAAGAAAASPQIYRGGLFSPGSFNYVSNVWSDLFAAIVTGTWTNEVQQGITKSGSSITVTEAGWYQINAFWQAFISTTPPLFGGRMKVNGTVVLSTMGYGGSNNGTTSEVRLNDAVLLSAGDVLTFEYACAIGTPTFTITSNQVSGAQVRIASISIHRIGATSTPSQGDVAHVVVDSTTAYTVLAADHGTYRRMTATAAKNVTVGPQSSEALPGDYEHHFDNDGPGDLTFIQGAGVLIKPPVGGTLVVPQNGQVTLKRLAPDVLRLIGATVPA